MKTDIFEIVRLKDNKNFNQKISDFEINIINEDKESLLQVAIAYNNLEIAEDLIKRGININHQDKKGFTALHYIAEYCYYKLGEILVKNGADINIVDNFGNNALWTATFNARGKYELVGLLVENGGNPNNKNNNSKSPLDFAKQIGDNKLVDILSKNY